MGDTAEHILASVKVTEVIVEWVGQPPLQVTQSYSLTEKHSQRILYNRLTNSKHPKPPIRKIEKRDTPTNPMSTIGRKSVCNAETLYSMCCSGRNYENELRAFVGGKLPLLFLYHSHSHSLHCCQLDPQNALRLRSHNLWRHTLSSWPFPSNLMKILDHTA